MMTYISDKFNVEQNIENSILIGCHVKAKTKYDICQTCY